MLNNIGDKIIISLEEAFKKQKWILKAKINKNFVECIKNKGGKTTLEKVCSCLDDIWFNPKDKDKKWDANTYKGKKGKLLIEKIV